MTRQSTAIAAISGAQTVDRACGLLNEIARCGPSGARLIDLTERSRLSRPTVHRILQSLSAANFVRQDPKTRKYQIGSALYILGLAAPNPLEQLAEIRPALEGLAMDLGDTVYLMMRQGDETVCLARAEGAAPVRTYLIEVGAIRPIGTTIAGATMLAPLRDDEIEAVLKRTAKAMTRYRNATAEYVRRKVQEVRRDGYCVSKATLIEGVVGLSAAVPASHGAPCLAISISAASLRMPDKRIKGVASALVATCEKLGKMLGRAPRAR